jgi:hypothetical protein
MVNGYVTETHKFDEMDTKVETELAISEEGGEQSTLLSTEIAPESKQHHAIFDQTESSETNGNEWQDVDAIDERSEAVYEQPCTLELPKELLDASRLPDAVSSSKEEYNDPIIDPFPELSNEDLEALLGKQRCYCVLWSIIHLKLPLIVLLDSLMIA